MSNLRKNSKQFSDKVANKKGFTLIEVMVAIFIFAFGIISLTSLATSAIRATETGKRRTQAVNLTTQFLEKLKAIPFNKLQVSHTLPVHNAELAGECDSGYIVRICEQTSAAPPSFICNPTDVPIEVNGVKFFWEWTVKYVDLDNDGKVFNVGTAIDKGDLKRIDVTVTWTDIIGEHDMVLTTMRLL